MPCKTEIITAAVKRVIYWKEETNWFILDTSAGAAKGEVLFEPKEGDLLKLEGFWGVSKFNGKKEFTFKAALLDIPQDPIALLHYATEITKGMGEVAEVKILEAYGADWQKDPELTKVKGLSRQIKIKWKTTLETLANHEAQTQAVSFLLSKGGTLNLASLAWGRWKEQTITLVSENCYRLTELPNYGFSAIDTKIRGNFDITDDDPRRLDAAMLYVLEQLSSVKGTLVDSAMVILELSKIVPDVISRIPNATTRLVTAGKIALLNSSIALQTDYENEGMIWDRFQK